MLKIFLDWCETNNVNVSRNSELFFMDVDFVIKPGFITKNGVYIDIVNADFITPNYLIGCDRFAASYGTLMVIPFEIINELGTITRYDIYDKFKILM